MTRNDILVLEASNSHMLNWCVDTACAVHSDMKSHIRLIFTIDKGSIPSSLTK